MNTLPLHEQRTNSGAYENVARGMRDAEATELTEATDISMSEADPIQPHALFSGWQVRFLCFGCNRHACNQDAHADSCYKDPAMVSINLCGQILLLMGAG